MLGIYIWFALILIIFFATAPHIAITLLVTGLVVIAIWSLVDWLKREKDTRTETGLTRADIEEALDAWEAEYGRKHPTRKG